jgi:hypothetical protein
VLQQIRLQMRRQFQALLAHLLAGGFAVPVTVADLHGGRDQVELKDSAFKKGPTPPLTKLSKGIRPFQDQPQGALSKLSKAVFRQFWQWVGAPHQ